MDENNLRKTSYATEQSELFYFLFDLDQSMFADILKVESLTALLHDSKNS